MNEATAFDPADLELLLALYEQDAKPGRPRRPPWTWPALHQTERAALARMIDVWSDTYNHVHAITPTELIPPCWRRHPALASELAVQVWLWYFVHLDPAATPQHADEYHLRRLPAFRSRLDRILGASPGECRRGEHPASWRTDTDKQIAAYLDDSTDRRDPSVDISLLGELHFAFLNGGIPL
jgi:hypothetical protein